MSKRHWKQRKPQGMTQPHPTRREVREAEALLQAAKVNGMSVAILANVMGISRQSVYRRLQKARVCLRRAAEALPPSPLKEDEYAALCAPDNLPAEAGARTNTEVSHES